MVAAGEIEQRMRPQKGGNPVAVYNPEQLETIAAERSAAVVIPTITAVAEPAASLVPAIARNSGSGSSAEFAEMLGNAIARALSAPKPSENIFTKAEAAIYAKRSADALDKLRKEGRLPNAGTKGRILYRRTDLDQL